MTGSPKQLHIVAFAIPYPADYGGVIDIYYKVKALHDLGVEVILHCYQYRRPASRALNRICKKVYYYPRRTFKNPFYGNLPYIINSRNSSALLQNLVDVDAPILFEGMHCTYHLQAEELKDRFKMVRMHNIEHHYYRQLEQVEARYFKKYFFRVEADKLKKHLNVLRSAQSIAAISHSDEKYLKRKFNNVVYIPAFHPNEGVLKPRKKESFVLYHGNLSVAENYEAAIKLSTNVFSKLSCSCVIAGNNAPNELRRVVDQYANIELVTDVESKEIDKLIAKAKVNVLYTDQGTGIKLKLLNALFKGGYAVVNPIMVKNTGLENLCIVANSFEKMIHKIENCLNDMEELDLDARSEQLSQDFDNRRNALLLMKEFGMITSVEEIDSTLVASL